MRYLLIFLLLASCATDKSATKYFDKHPDKGSGYCAAKYPVRVGDVKVSEQDWSDTADYCLTCLVGITDTTIKRATFSDGIGVVRLPDTIIRTITHYHTERDSIPYIDSAATHNMRLQLAGALQTNTALQNTIIANNKAANAKYDALESKRKMWMWIALAACGGFLGIKGIVWLIKRII